MVFVSHRRFSVRCFPYAIKLGNLLSFYYLWHSTARGVSGLSAPPSPPFFARRRHVVMSAVGDDNGTTKVRVLALHGSEGNAKEFERALMDLSEPAFFAHGMEWDVTAVNAPFTKGKCTISTDARHRTNLAL